MDRPEAGRNEVGNEIAELRSIASGPGESRRSRRPHLPAPHALDERYHRALADAGAGPHLQRELDVLYPQAARHARAYGPVGPRAIAAARAEHAAIVQAFATGEGNLAARRASAHWRQSLARLQPVVGMIGEQGTW